MRKVFLVAQREYAAIVRTKGFIIGLVIAPVFMGMGLIMIALSEKTVDLSDKKVAVLDHTGRIGLVLVTAAEERNQQEVSNESGKKVQPAYLLELIEPNTENPSGQRLVLSDQVRNGKLHAFLEIGSAVVHPGQDREHSHVLYYATNATIDKVRDWIDRPLNNQLRKLRLEDAGIDESEVPDLFTRVRSEPMGLVSVDQQTGQIKEAERKNEFRDVVIPIAFMIMMYMLSLMGSMPLLHSVLEEKTQRIAEFLLGSIRPFEFMLGKVLGAVGVTLTSSAVYLSAVLVLAFRMGVQDQIPYHLLPWFFSYLLLMILMMGSLNTAVGSACGDAKDLQNFTFPTMLPVLIPMFCFVAVLREPSSTFATVLSLIPPFTPMLMLLRQALPGGVPGWQPWAGLAGVILMTLFMIWMGGRIFRVAILVQGKSPKLGRFFKWAIKG